jgi:hypothetical protein
LEQACDVGVLLADFVRLGPLGIVVQDDAEAVRVLEDEAPEVRLARRRQAPQDEASRNELREFPSSGTRLLVQAVHSALQIHAFF